MVAGDARLRSSSLTWPDPPTSEWKGDDLKQPALARRALGFNCLHYANNPPEPSLYRHSLPDKAFLDEKCTSGLRLELMFPSCWNGKDLDSPNHKSHVAYPNLLNGGECPEEFPTRLVTLFYETIWNTYAFKDREGKFVLANGDPTGKSSTIFLIDRRFNSASQGMATTAISSQPGTITCWARPSKNARTYPAEWRIAHYLSFSRRPSRTPVNSPCPQNSRKTTVAGPGWVCRATS